MKMWQKILLTIIVLIVISLLVFLYSKYIGAKMFYVKEYPLYSTTIDDSYNGLKIAHLSDIHYGLGLTKNDLEKIVKDTNNSQKVKIPVELSVDSHLLTLSTCVKGKSNKRFLVQAVLLNEDEL